MIFPTLSVVIPAFNVEGYVGKCLDSVRDQSLPFTEVIVVDDGSTDSTFDIISQYSDLPRLKIIRTKNNGLGPARNIGASAASSEFLLFIDSDDFIHSDLVSSFLDVIKLNSSIDLFAFSSSKIDDCLKEDSMSAFCSYPFDEYSRADIIFLNLIKSKRFCSSACTYIFRKSLIDWDSKGFRNIVHEDEEFTQRLYFKSHYVYLSRKVLYFYRLRIGSIMRATSFSIKRFLLSRYGYLIALSSCLYLMTRSLGRLRLFYALFLRSRYLSYHAFFPFLTVIIKVLASPKILFIR